MIRMVMCHVCQGEGDISGGKCYHCFGLGKIEKRVLPSETRQQTFFRGALINTTRKGTKQ